MIRLHLLGAPSIDGDMGQAQVILRQPKQLALLALLAVPRPGRWLRRESLILYLWPDRDGGTARAALRGALHGLREALGREAVVSRGDDEVALDADVVWCDADEVARAATAPDTALAHYRGDLLEGFSAAPGPDFEQWLDQERARLRALLRDAAAKAAARAEAAGDPPGAIAHIRTAVAIDPFDERLHRQLMVLLEQAGDRAGALASYDTLTRLLAREFQAVPAPATVALASQLRERHHMAPDPVRSVAVLPWRNLTDDPDGTELCEGLAADLSSLLARLPELHVRARGEVHHAASAHGDARAIGRALAVDAVVAGSLARVGGTLELAFELVRVADGRLLLGDRVASRLEQLFRAPLDVATALSRALKLDSPDHLGRLATGGTSRNGDAWVLYVRGQYLFLRAAASGDPGDLQRSRELFERALVHDPACAPALAGLANFYAVASARNLLKPFAEHFAMTIALSEQAMALDPTLAVPHVHFGVKAMYLDGDMDRAGREFGAAIAVEPTYAEAHRFLAIWQMLQGDHAAALASFRTAVRQEPDIPIYRNGLADALMALGRHDEAIEELRLALDRDPKYRAARDRLLRCLEKLGRLDEAVAERLLDERANSPAFSEALKHEGAEGYCRLRGTELRQVIASTLARMAPGAPVNAGDLFNPPELALALAHAELGEWEQARAWQEQCCARQPWRRPWFASHPTLAPRTAAPGA